MIYPAVLISDALSGKANAQFLLSTAYDKAHIEAQDDGRMIFLISIRRHFF